MTLHRPVIRPILSGKYGNDGPDDFVDWDGTVRLACTCGWRESRLSAGWKPASLTAHWRNHTTASAFDIPLRESHSE